MDRQLEWNWIELKGMKQRKIPGNFYLFFLMTAKIFSAEYKSRNRVFAIK